MISDLDDVKEMLKMRIEDLCRKLLPDGKRDGRFWLSYNPVTGDYDRSTPELKVPLNRDIGAWKDWRSGEKGDVIQLISYIKGLDFKETMRWARDFLGLAQMGAADRRALEQRMRQQRADSDKRSDDDRKRQILAAERLWYEGQIVGARSAAEAHAWGYFLKRGCDLRNVKNLDEATFRFSASTEWWKGAEWRHQGHLRIKTKDGPSFPAVHSAMRGPLGQILSCHVTWLDPILPAKAPVSPAKMMFGPSKGAMIRLTHGPEGVPPEMATQATPVVICEGIETGLSLAIAIPEARVWAAGSLSNMGNAPVGMDCVGAIVVARDNNDGNDQAQKQLAGAIGALTAAGKPVQVIASHVGDDFNDLQRGEE
jgi:hypothetical protein